MVTPLFKPGSRPAPRIEEVLADIRYFRRCINEAGPENCAARRAAQAAYAPFLDRRIKLLAMLISSKPRGPADSGDL